jgi:cell division protein FtsZ
MEQERIEEVIQLSRPTISVVGIGGAGCNIVSWVKERGVVGAKVLALNTDASHLGISKGDRRILIGEKLCRGLGCGGYPERGAEAMKESVSTVVSEMANSNMIFITCGLGGGTGTGGSWVLASELRDLGVLTVGVVTVPFSVEKARIEKARDGLERLRSICDTVIVIDNNRLRKMAGNLPLKQAFGVANELMGLFVKNVTEAVTTPSLVNIDFADLKSIMERGGISAIGVGESDGDDRVDVAVKQALDTQLLDIYDMAKASGALIHVVGGEDMTLEEVNRAGELVQQNLSPETKMIWGARVDENLTGHMRVMVTLTGIESSFLSPPPSSPAPPPPPPPPPPSSTPPVEESTKRRGFFRSLFSIF